MAITLNQAPEVGQVTPQIQQTVNPYTLRLDNAQGLQIEDLGNYAAGLGKQMFSNEEINRAAQKAYEDATTGKMTFQNTLGLSKADQTYNNMASSFITAKASKQLETTRLQLEASPNFNPQSAASDYANLSKNVITQTMAGVPSDLQGKVGSALQMQSMQQGEQVTAKAIGIDRNQHIAEGLQSIGELKDQAVSAIQSGNVTLADKLITSHNETVAGMLQSGAISPFQATNLTRDAQTSIEANKAVATGNYEGLSPQATAEALRINNQKNMVTDVDQMNQGFSFQKYIIDRSNGINTPLPAGIGLTKPQEARVQAADEDNRIRMAKEAQRMQEESSRRNEYNQARIDQANTVGGYVNALKSMTLDQQQDVLLGNADRLPDQYKDLAKSYTSLPERVQGQIYSINSRNQRLISQDPINGLGLDKVTDDNGVPLMGAAKVQKQAAELSARGYPLTKLVNSSEMLNIQQQYQADPVGTLSNIKEQYGDLLPSTGVIGKLAKSTGNMGLYAADNVTSKDYMIGLTAKGTPGKNINLKGLSSSEVNTLANLPTITQSVVKDLVSTVSKARPYDSPNEILKSAYSLDGGNFVQSHDDALFNTSIGKNALANTIGLPANRLDQAQVYYNPVTKNYDGYINGKQYFNFTPQEVNTARMRYNNPTKINNNATINPSLPAGVQNKLIDRQIDANN